MPAPLRDFSCTECGKVFQARRENAKTCSPTCRRRASRARDGAPAEPPQPPTVPLPPVPDPPLVAEVTKSLTAVGKLDTWEGQMAVSVARKLAAPNAPGAAALMKELTTLMDKLVAPQGGSGPAPAGRRGTLATRRQQKRGAA